jgi:hypothetical protein
VSDYLLEKHTIALLLENFLEKDPVASISGKLVFHVRSDRNLIGLPN